MYILLHTQLILNSFTTNFALRSPDVETLEENKEDGVSAVYVCERFVEIDVHRRHTSILFKGRIYFVSFLDIPQYSIFYPLALLIILLKFIPGSSIDLKYLRVQSRLGEKIRSPAHVYIYLDSFVSLYK